MGANQFLNNLLVMSKSERNGTLVLLFLLILVIVIRFVVPSFMKEDRSSLNDIEEQIAFLEQQRDSIRQIEFQYQKVTSPSLASCNKAKIRMKDPVLESQSELFLFDPNSIEYEDLIRLGLSEKTAHTFIKFRERGAVFSVASDLLKVYGIDSSCFSRLSPFIRIEVEKENHFEAKLSPAPTSVLRTIEINSADSATWITLPGIGPVFAGRICRFRNYLGGFVKVQQLNEVYHFPAETYTLIVKFLVVDSLLVEKMNINFCTIDQLKKHPYCRYNDARRIVDYRATHGSYSSISKLLSDSILTSDVYERLSPYLTIQ
jgi:DNA uptake protein ComE-like DNA-binding protein